MLFAILFAVVMLWMPNDMYGQTGDITLHVEEAPLGDVFQQIEDDYGYMFLYRDDAIDLARKVSVSVTDATIGQVLDRILDDKTGFEVNGRQVTIFLKDNRDDGTAQQASEPESSTVSGIVKDSQGQPVVGAFVMEKGTSNGVSTDFDGKWSIKVSNPDAYLVFSCLGFRDQEIRPGSTCSVRSRTAVCGP